MDAETRTLIQEVRELNQEVDRRVAIAVDVCIKEVDRGPTCRHGCDACCYNMVTATLAETVCLLDGCSDTQKVGAREPQMKADFKRLANPIDIPAITSAWRKYSPV